MRIWRLILCCILLYPRKYVDEHKNYQTFAGFLTILRDLQIYPKSSYLFLFIVSIKYSTNIALQIYSLLNYAASRKKEFVLCTFCTKN